MVDVDAAFSFLGQNILLKPLVSNSINFYFPSQDQRSLFPRITCVRVVEHAQKRNKDCFLKHSTELESNSWLKATAVVSKGQTMHQRAHAATERPETHDTTPASLDTPEMRTPQDHVSYPELSLPIVITWRQLMNCFKHARTTIRKQNYIREEIMSRWRPGTASYHLDRNRVSYLKHKYEYERGHECETWSPALRETTSWRQRISGPKKPEEICGERGK